ncbi:MAG: methenyltetrahydromethanopterin cyclohydrolase [Acidobacteria bacterium]|nr:methenyltetrahydromethanopterin cyclohydrolase [Acidobacteriota bacterium]
MSVNQRASAIIQQMISEQEALSLRVNRLKNGTTVLDAGIEAPGSLEAGRLFSCACLGGLGQVTFIQQSFDGGTPDRQSGFQLPAVEVHISHPHIACMASQYAGWAIRLNRYSAIGSGPARALYANEEIYGKLDYVDRSETAVLMLESRSLPDEDVAAFVAQKCGVRPEQLFLAVAPTASLVGSIQVAARSAETGMHKLAELGFDVRCITAAAGICPMAPVAADDLRAIGRTNDAILYGGTVFYTAAAEDEELADLILKVPSESSKDYGTPFYDLFKRYKGDFYQIDRMLFSPAQVIINNTRSGRSFRAGRLNPSLLLSSLIEG